MRAVEPRPDPAHSDEEVENAVIIAVLIRLKNTSGLMRESSQTEAE